jgi:hypothetical protein
MGAATRGVVMAAVDGSAFVFYGWRKKNACFWCGCEVEENPPPNANFALIY